jgi:hypothetical protein
MTDRFAHHAADWDRRPLPQQLSEGIGAAIAARVARVAAPSGIGTPS